MDTQILELINGQDGIGVLHINTGEIVMLFDTETSLEQKADVYSFAMDMLDAQIDVHKNYISKHKNKIEKIILLQDKIKETIKNQMESQNIAKIKTPESTLYFQERKKLLYDIKDIPIDYCATEIVKKKLLDETIPDLIEQGLIQETTTKTLCRR